MKLFKLAVATMILCPLFTAGAMSDNLIASFPKARIIRAHNRQGAVVFWDATAYIERLAKLRTSKEAALKILEFEAFKIFDAEAHALSSSDRHLTVVAAFARTGAINPQYQTKSFDGVQNLLTLDGNVHFRVKFSKDAEQKAQSGIFPPGLKLRVVPHALDETE